MWTLRRGGRYRGLCRPLAPTAWREKNKIKVPLPHHTHTHTMAQRKKKTEIVAVFFVLSYLFFCLVRTVEKRGTLNRLHISPYFLSFVKRNFCWASWVVERRNFVLVGGERLLFFCFTIVWPGSKRPNSFPGCVFLIDQHYLSIRKNKFGLDAAHFLLCFVYLFGLVSEGESIWNLLVLVRPGREAE